jgi:hypothetical protein
MENPNTQRKAIGLLMAFATALTLIAIWKLPETESKGALRDQPHAVPI